MADGFRTEGYASPHADFLSAEPGSSPTGEELQHRDDVVESAIERALEQSAEVVFVRHHPDMQALGLDRRRAALLTHARRYAGAPEAAALVSGQALELREAVRAVGVGRDRERARVAPAQQLRVHERVAVPAHVDVGEQAAVAVRALTPDLAAARGGPRRAAR